MSEGIEGILILLGVTVAAALTSHALFKQYLLASGAAAVTSVATFQALNYAHLGHVDPFLPVAVLVSTPVCFVLSLAIGLPFRQKRMKQEGRT
jgi:hypothetical protein